MCTRNYFQTKVLGVCLECLGKLSDKSLVVQELNLMIHFKAYKHNETTASENLTNFLLLVEKVVQRNIGRCLCMKGVLSTLMDSVQDTVPSAALTLYPMHRVCEFTKSITTLHVRCRLHYYFKFKSEQLVVGKAKKKNKRAQILMHQ